MDNQEEEILSENLQGELVMFMESVMLLGYALEESGDPRMYAILRPLIKRAERIDSRIWSEFPP
jgi:hypothetical protein